MTDNSSGGRERTLNLIRARCSASTPTTANSHARLGACCRCHATSIDQVKAIRANLLGEMSQQHRRALQSANAADADGGGGEGDKGPAAAAATAAERPAVRAGVAAAPVKGNASGRSTNAEPASSSAVPAKGKRGGKRGAKAGPAPVFVYPQGEACTVVVLKPGKDFLFRTGSPMVSDSDTCELCDCGGGRGCDRDFCCDRGRGRHCDRDFCCDRGRGRGCDRDCGRECDRGSGLTVPATVAVTVAVTVTATVAVALLLAVAAAAACVGDCCARVCDV
eukprot:359866-Chlamydomonas_euryale.AAC.2